MKKSATKTEAPPADTAASDPRHARILKTARDIIERSGDFNLPMRTLAAEAQVSLRVPYELFGSKPGIIQAILMEDIREFDDQIDHLNLSMTLDLIFVRLVMGIENYRRRQPFYQALFRASQSSEYFQPARLALNQWRSEFRNLKDLRFLRADVDTDILSQTLTDICFAALGSWARGEISIDFAAERAGYGWALVLQSAATKTHTTQMQIRVQEYQSKLQARMPEDAAA